MLRINKVSAGRGAAWINESISVLKNAGKSIWIPALLIGLLGSIPYLSAMQGLLILFFYGSLILCINNPNQQNNLFSGFQNGNFIRILPILLLNIVFTIFIIIALLPQLKVVIEATMQGQALNEQQALQFFKSVLTHMTWMLPLGILLHWVTLLAVPLASLGEQPGGSAIKQALQATFRNLPAMIVNFICLIIMSTIIVIVCIIPIAIVNLAFSANIILLNIALIPFTALMTALIIALMSANMLQAYRDIFGDAEAIPTKDTEFLM